MHVTCKNRYACKWIYNSSQTSLAIQAGAWSHVRIVVNGDCDKPPYNILSTKKHPRKY